MGYRNNTISVDTTVEVELDDVLAKLGTEELVEILVEGVGTDGVCDVLDEEEVFEWTMKQHGFVSPETVNACLGDDDFKGLVLETLSKDLPALKQLLQIPGVAKTLAEISKQIRVDSIADRAMGVAS